MPRPSQNLDRKLVAAALAMLPETGFSGLTVREISRRARVNVGMFHYHFKSREAFVHRVLWDVYGDFLASFQEAADGEDAPRERLRRVLIAYAQFARRNRVFYALMLRELVSGNKEMLAFAKRNFPRHSEVMMRLMEECRKAGVVRELPPMMSCMFAMSTMGVPNVAATALERNGLKTIGGRPTKGVIDGLLSDETIEIRADMVLAALAPGRGK